MIGDYLQNNIYLVYDDFPPQLVQVPDGCVGESLCVPSPGEGSDYDQGFLLIFHIWADLNVMVLWAPGGLKFLDDVGLGSCSWHGVCS